MALMIYVIYLFKKQFKRIIINKHIIISDIHQKKSVL